MWHIVNESIQWALLVWVVIWMILHIQKSVGTWAKFEKLEEAAKSQFEFNTALFNSIARMRRWIVGRDKNANL